MKVTKKLLAILTAFFAAAAGGWLLAQSGDTSVIDSLASGALPAAEIPEPEKVDPAKIVSEWEALVGALTLVWGWVTKYFRAYIKPSTKLPFVFTVIAGAVVIVGGMVQSGVVDFIPAAIAVLSAMGIYDVIKGLFKARQQEPATKTK